MSADHTTLSVRVSFKKLVDTASTAQGASYLFVLFWLHRWDRQKNAVQAGKDAVDHWLAVPACSEIRTLMRQSHVYASVHPNTM